MHTAVIDSARDAVPGLWRRYFEVFVQGLRAKPSPPEPLDTPPAGPHEVAQVMAAFKLPRR